MSTSPQETAREREVLKYDGTFMTRANFNTQLLNSPTSRPALLTSTDTTLTSLAQLAAFRLNCKRALVSLFDRHHQYIVAEATHDTPLAPSQPRQELWLCGSALPRAHGICEAALLHPAGPTLPVTVVPDLALDTRFSTRRYISEWPHNHFYAGVPLRSPTGINIGVLCVFDDLPRSCLDPESIQYLRDLSFTMMDYLESRRVRSVSSRNGCMVRGLCSFVEGRSTISGRKPPACDEDASYIIRNDVQNPLAPSAEQLLGPVPRHVYSTPSPASLDGQVPAVEMAKLSIDTSRPASTLPCVSKSAPEDRHLTQIQRVFSKAAHIIREATEVDDVVFVDASVRSFGGLVKRRGSTRSSSSISDSLSSCSSDDGSSTEDFGDDSAVDACCNVFGFSNAEKSSVNGSTPNPGYARIPERFLRTLLRHYPGGRVFNFEEDGTPASAESSTEPAPYQNGSQTPSPTQPSRPPLRGITRRASSFRRDESRTLASIFPGVRSLIMLPMWDVTRERWSASGFILSRSPLRFFTVDGDLSFLRAFGMSIQAEITRVETLFSERAKSDMLGSLSHELRSPLHGLLGACELIHDTSMTVFQRDMVHMVETSGRTLLDVIDHLLDYSKINNFRHNTKRGTSDQSRGGSLEQPMSIESGMMALSTDIELDLLTEEVVESVFTGYNFQRISVAQMASQDGPEIVDAASLKQSDIAHAVDSFTHSQSKVGEPNNNILVYLDIDPNACWKVAGVPGALRRIIMNIFGNALKFTDKGFVYVGLRIDTVVKGNKRRKYVVLTVIDSGSGISEDFLKNRIFKPFHQEDKLSPGTGLGLSIAHSITSTLGGHIRVHSQVGQGSKFCVYLPLAHTTGTSPRGEPFVSQVKQLAGLRVALLGFSHALQGPFVPGTKC